MPSCAAKVHAFLGQEHTRARRAKLIHYCMTRDNCRGCRWCGRVSQGRRPELENLMPASLVVVRSADFCLEPPRKLGAFGG